MLEVLQYEFMRHALAAGLLASLICGIMGTLVVVNRIVFLSGGIAHAAYGGIGLSFFMGWPYMAGTMGFSLAAALAMGAVTLKGRHRADTVIGVMWAVGMAVGIVLLDLTPGYQSDLMSYLFGSILTVSGSDLWLMTAVSMIVLLAIVLFYNAFLAMAFDHEFARVRGIPVRTLYLGFIALLAVAIVFIIQVVGLILVIALLTIPPFVAEKFSRSLGWMMAWSCLLSALFTICGLFLSYYFNLTAGACIILAAGVGFCISIIAERMGMRRSAVLYSTRAESKDSDHVSSMRLP